MGKALLLEEIGPTQMIDRPAVTSIIVAGGRGKRFGRDKLAEDMGGRTLLQRVVDAIGPLSNDIVIAIAPGQPAPELSPASPQIVTDVYPGKGTLGGIYTGLVSSHCFHSLVVAGDMPFLNISLLRYMIDIASGFDVVIPRINGMLEPLHAVYSKNCIGPMREQIERDELRIRIFLDRVKVRYLEEAEVEEFDPDRMSFFNINTRDDLRKARVLLQQIAGIRES